MSFLAPLLDAQALDLEADSARAHAETLPERKILPKLSDKIARVTVELTEAREKRRGFEEQEEELSRAVAEIVRSLEAAEVERYSGKRKSRDSASAHDAAQNALREKQTGLEAQELELLESIDTLDARVAEFESTIAGHRAEAEKVVAAIRKGEAEVAATLLRLTAERNVLTASIPPKVLQSYERIRAQPRSGGRGATALVDGRCTGCRIQLPSLEKTRMLAEPEDALIQCPQCRKVLVRE